MEFEIRTTRRKRQSSILGNSQIAAFSSLHTYRKFCLGFGIDDGADRVFAGGLTATQRVQEKAGDNCGRGFILWNRGTLDGDGLLVLGQVARNQDHILTTPGADG